MLKHRLSLCLLLLVCFCLSTWLEPRLNFRRTTSGESQSVLALLLGDGRRMFANSSFAKADAYFHGGNYPSIFDAASEENHMAEAASDSGEPADHEHENEPAETTSPKPDWIQSFGSHFRPSGDTHLIGGNEREMLPWLKLATELDPHQVVAYVTIAYWLRSRMNMVDEAEQVLRDGIQRNPNSPELLFELGRLNFENRKNNERARNLLEAAQRRWQQAERPRKNPNYLLLEQIYSGLAKLELQEGRMAKAIEHLESLKEVSPHPEEVQKRIEEVKAGQTSPELKPLSNPVESH